ncbi:hypothetical protein CEXT_170631 [Caerostris extrusa]|uniref:Uncharacterized protein n=1 Tax=Caerostris extrusa TaxID=172846 RepID=A0AAV4NZK4_CAEEX|nr:hypothetical protein CEXT_170631 [Caerostris extrusa]
MRRTIPGRKASKCKANKAKKNLINGQRSSPMTTAEYEIRSVIESCRWMGSVGVSHSQDQGCCRVVTCVNVKLAGDSARRCGLLNLTFGEFGFIHIHGKNKFITFDSGTLDAWKPNAKRFLLGTFETKQPISYSGSISWPLRLLELTPADFLLYSYLYTSDQHPMGSCKIKEHYPL